MTTENQSPSKAHNHEQVLAAIGALTKQDLARLRVAAATWIRNLGLDTVAADADDLVSDAIFRTTSGQRTWRVGVSLHEHLRGVMRSVADSWRKSAERRAVSGRLEVQESDFPTPDAGSSDGDPADFNPVSNAPSSEPDPERLLTVKQSLASFEAHFADDEVAGAVIHGMWEQMKGPEICREWNLTKKEYAAAVRRIRRYANRRKGASRGD